MFGEKRQKTVASSHGLLPRRFFMSDVEPFPI